jgi:ribose transport system permease protein
MATNRLQIALARLSSDYGMAFVLLLLCALFSLLTVREYDPAGAAAARSVAEELGAGQEPTSVVIVASTSAADADFADTLTERLRAAGWSVRAVVKGTPRQARLTLEQLAADGKVPKVIAASTVAARWLLLRERGQILSTLAVTKLVSPTPSYGSSFLTRSNLLNITSQIAVIAILGVGMTLVVITGGIDLSVGSLIALAAIVATLLVQDYGGAEDAAAPVLIYCCLAGIVCAALVGLFSGAMVTFFAVPSFIVTLAIMLVARGLAETLSQSQSVYQLPESFTWLGREADLLGIPNAVVLMGLLYIAAHILLTRMTLGRYIYAVGGNAEAARLSGVPVRRVLLFVYVVSAALAGLGGIVMASQFKSASPNDGLEYELYVIAAVVVGGTSLRGGQGHVLGTLIGALIIAVINSGMNQLGLAPPTQKIVLGGVILGAVLLDTLKRGWGWRRGGGFL